MNRAIRKLMRRWAAQGKLHGDPVPPAELDAFEARHRTRLPDDVREWFLTVNGIRDGKDGAMDDQFVTFWNLSQVRPLPDEDSHFAFPGAERYLVFADYMLWCYAFALRLPDTPGGPTPVFALYAPDQMPQVAPSFTAFLKRYAAGDEEVISPPWPPVPQTLLRTLRRRVKRWVRLPPSFAEVPPRLRNRRSVQRAVTRFVREQQLKRPELGAVGETQAVLRMRVTTQGRPEDVTVDQSSGDPLLDAGAQHVGATMRFTPARIGRGRVTVWITIPITYRFGKPADAGKTVR